jgi:hypothetical protein
MMISMLVDNIDEKRDQCVFIAFGFCNMRYKYVYEASNMCARIMIVLMHCYGVEMAIHVCGFS